MFMYLSQRVSEYYADASKRISFSFYEFIYLYNIQMHQHGRNVNGVFMLLNLLVWVER